MKSFRLAFRCLPGVVPGRPTAGPGRRWLRSLAGACLAAGLTATAGNAQVSLTWKAPASDGGAQITSYNPAGGAPVGGAGRA